MACTSSTIGLQPGPGGDERLGEPLAIHADQDAAAGRPCA
jgi:hypothetical protein